MRFERMVIEAGSNTFSLAMHPRLTIIAGVGPVERDGLAGELIGALGSSRAGVHLELVTDHGRRLAVFRPAGARHRVVDIDEATDVSDEFRNADGAISLLEHEGIDLRKARRAMRLNRADLVSTAASDRLVGSLAERDQTELWSAAARVRVTDEQLQAEAEAVGSAPEDAEVIDRIERRHNTLEAAAETHTRLRRFAVLVAGAACVLSVPVAAIDPMKAGPLLAIGALMTTLAFLYRSRVSRAERAEQEALEAAGADSYLGFQVQRVNGLVNNQQGRRRLLAAAEEHREAASRWIAAAGDVSVDWALEHHEQIVGAAKLRADMRSLGAMSSTAPDMDEDATAALAQALIGRMAGARRIGASTESFPIILDEPFVGLEPTMKPALLELLSRTAGSPQAILLTDDEDVASWARLEALAGELTILEPTPHAQDAPASDQHIVA